MKAEAWLSEWNTAGTEFPDDDDHLALAVQILSEATVNAPLFAVGGLYVATEIAAIDFRHLAFTANNTALHFLCHGFPQLVQEDECGLVGQAQVAGQR
jgi:hypothetical protein